MDPKKYGGKVQFMKEEDITPALSTATIKLLYQNIGSLFFYGRALDMTFLVSLSTLESSQACGIEATFREMV